MGIKNLYKLIDSNAPNSIIYKNIKDLNGKKIIIDASIIIYQSVLSLKKLNLKNEENDISHILGFINKTIMFLKNNITPIYVFDGKSPKIKENTLIQRNEKKQKIIDKMNSDDYNSDNKLNDEKKIFTPSKKQINEIKEILKLLGIEYIESEYEADPICAKLVIENICYGVVSQDMDLLTFGSKILIKDLSSNKKFKEINLDILLNELELKYIEFIDLCILLGCDYCPKIPKIGEKTALFLIKKYKSIDEFLKNEGRKYKIPENYNYKQARELFLDKDLNYKINKSNLNKIEFKDILLKKYNFNIKSVEKYLNKL